MAGIFISYRRADSDGWAGRLRDALGARFGKRVFQDVESIADGEIFSEVIGRALQECDVALIIIGPNWANARDGIGRRLDQTDDWVRTETALVLNRGIRVIPVLVGGAIMPRAEDLPEELRSITLRQAREIRSNSWDSDVALLTSHLKQIVGRPRQRPAWLYALASLAVVAVGAFAGSRYFGQSATAPPPAERAAAAPAAAPSPAEKTVAAPAVVPAPAPVPAPRTGTADVAVAKPPAVPPPAKAAPAPAVEPRVAPPAAVTRPPSSAAVASAKPQPAPEPEQLKVARGEPPAAKVTPDTPPQEPRRAAAPAAAEAPAPAAAIVASLNLPNRPSAARELRVGDSWTYRLREVRFNKDLANVTHEISGGDKSGIRETLRLGPRGDAQRRLPLEPRIFEQPLDQGAMLFEFSPFMPAFSELQPGVSWSKIPGVTSSDSITSWRFSGKVTGRERVRVAAGSFDTIKAELEGQLDLSSPMPRDPRSETIVSYQTVSVWFAPEVGRAIKYERRTYNRVRTLLEHEQYELVSYKLQ
jgi:hypothetical protein